LVSRALGAFQQDVLAGRHTSLARTHRARVPHLRQAIWPLFGQCAPPYTPFAPSVIHRQKPEPHVSAVFRAQCAAGLDIDAADRYSPQVVSRLLDPF
jgi:hypothetical protein